jgi:hypothetical protein
MVSIEFNDTMKNSKMFAKDGHQMPEIYYLALLRASESTLSRWSQLHLQALAPSSFPRRIDVRQTAGRENNCRIIIFTTGHRPQHDKKHVVLTPLVGQE